MLIVEEILLHPCPQRVAEIDTNQNLLTGALKITMLFHKWSSSICLFRKQQYLKISQHLMWDNFDKRSEI